MFTKVMTMFGLMLALNGVADDDGAIVNILVSVIGVDGVLETWTTVVARV